MWRFIENGGDAGTKGKHPPPPSRPVLSLPIDTKKALHAMLSTAYPQILARVVHNRPVDSHICNTFSDQKLNFI